MYWILIISPQGASINGVAVGKTDSMASAIRENMNLCMVGIPSILLMPN